MQKRKQASACWQAPCTDEESGSHLAFPPRSGQFTTRRLLLIGTGKLAVRAYQEIQRSMVQQGVVGIIDSNPQIGWAARFPTLSLLGGFDDLRAVVMRECIDEIHVAVPLKSCFDWMGQIAATGQELGVPVCFHFSLFDGTSQPAVRAIADGALELCYEHPTARRLPRIAKRCVDIVIAPLALLCLSPIFILIAASIKLTSPGPIFFKQKRIGFRRRQFSMLKFRTMTKNAEELRDEIKDLNNAKGISFKVFDDPRVTAVGRILRRTSLDELPQLINVLRGEISLVGPRPIPVWVAEQMHGSAYARRFSVPQGITGLWQVEGREQDFDRMVAQDLRYVDNWTFGLDIKILLKTIPAVFRGDGAH